MSTLHSLPDHAQAEGEGPTRRTYFTSDIFIDEFVQDYTGQCLFCGDDLAPPAIIWHTVTQVLWFHPPCAEKLGLALVRDVARIGYVHKNEIERTVRKLTDGIPG